MVVPRLGHRARVRAAVLLTAVVLAPLGAPAQQPASPRATPTAARTTGSNLIDNGDFSKEETGWEVQRLEGTEADDKVETMEGGKHAIHITVPVAGEKRYFVQLAAKGTFPVLPDKTYTLTFRARSKPETQIGAMLTPAHGAFEQLALQTDIEVVQDWTNYTFTLTPKHGTDAARLVVSGLAAKAAEFWITDMSLKQNP